MGVLFDTGLPSLNTILYKADCKSICEWSVCDILVKHWTKLQPSEYCS